MAEPANNDTIIADKWDNMIGKEPKDKVTTLNSILYPNNQLCAKINIFTDKIQNDTGANKAVTNNKQLLYKYKDIAPYPIGGVKADDIAIVCTGEGLLP